MKATRLRNIRLDEVSAVPAGANQHAHIKLVKNAPTTSGGTAVTVTLPDILKALAALTDADRAEVAKAVTVAKVDPLADLPADHPVRKRLDAQAAELAELRKAQADAAEALAVNKSMDVAKSMPHLPETPEVVAKLLRRVEKADATLGTELVTYLRGADAVLKAATARLGTPIGKSGGDEDAPTELAKAVTALRKANPALSEAQAVMAARQANPHLSLED